MNSSFSRRALLGAAAIGGAVLPALYAASAQAATDPRLQRLQESIRRLRARNDKVLTGRRSVNGWEMERAADVRGNIHSRSVVGTALAGVQVRLGDVEALLFHVVRRFHYEVEELRAGDVVGWRAPSAVRVREAESNLASGTAVQIRPGHYPAGVRGGFFPLQEAVIRDILASLEGVVRWGGDDARPDESLFSIDLPPGDPRVAELAARLRGAEEIAAEKVGVAVDVATPARRKAATALKQRQRR
jgi:hypothetical protein